MKRILFLLLIAFAFSPAVETSRSQSSAPRQDTRINLSGIWEDAGDPVIITDTGGSVTARYTNIKSCRHDGTVTPYSSGFVVSGSGSTLRGTGTICYYGPKKEPVDPPATPDPSPRGVQRSNVTLKVAANGKTLEGTQEGYHGSISFTLTRKCDAQNMCATLNSAYESVSRAADTLNSGGQPPGSFQEFKAGLSSQLNSIDQELKRCGNPSNKIGNVIALMDFVHSWQDRDGLGNIKREVNTARVDFMQSGGPCSGGVPTSGGTSPTGGDPTSDEDSSSGEENAPDESACKEGEEPKTAKDNVAFSQLVRVIDHDIRKLEQQAKVLRGSRELAAINARIVKIKQMRAFWQQARTVSCVRAEVTQSITAYLEEKKAGGAVGACSKLCTATAAWVASMSGSPLQRLFTADSCSAMCN